MRKRKGNNPAAYSSPTTHFPPTNRLQIPLLYGQFKTHDLNTTTKRHRIRHLIEEILPKIDNYVRIQDSLCRSLDPTKINKRVAEFAKDEDPHCQAAASVFMEGVAKARVKMLKVFQVFDAVEEQADTRGLLLRCGGFIECDLCWG